MANKEYHKEYYLNNKDKWSNDRRKSLAKAWRKRCINKTLTNSARKRAKAKGIPFDINYTDVIVPEYCPILNIKLEPNQEGTKRYSKNSPSLDRINPELGYVKGNIQVISHLANVMKNCATKEELKVFANWVLKNYD
jgi:hypothetical protein